MKKAVVVVQQKDAEGAIKDLRKLGVLHVEHQNIPIGKDINDLQEDIALIDDALEVLSASVIEMDKAKKQGELNSYSESLKDEQCRDENCRVCYRDNKKQTFDGKLCAKHIINRWKHYQQLKDYGQSLKHTISEWEPWGDFDPQKIQDLRKKSIFMKLYEVPHKGVADFCEGRVVKKVFAVGGMSYCVVVSKDDCTCAHKEIQLPKQSLSAMRAKMAEDKKVMDAIISEINKSTVLNEDFINIRKNLEKEIELQEALYGMGKEDRLSFVSGYLPAQEAQDLLKEAKLRQWAVVISDPSEGDVVPTLVRNPRWISIVSPIFKFLEILPDYREWDISPVFIVFFSLFFGMLIGDAGYGMIYILLIFWMHKKTGNKLKDKSVFTLFYLLSSCAVVWGLLTGTFFGQEWFLKIGYKPLVPAFNNPKAIQAFCFFVGALHLSIAHIWRAIMKLPSVSSLADIGWISMVWSVFLLAKMLILGDSFPILGKWLLIAGISLIVLFSNPQKNILKLLNVDLITIALGLIGSFGEVVSYIRLFAVGMAGVAIADAFNAMASRIGVGSIVAVIASVFVVMLGHALCLVLGPLSVLVHGVRLNLLEFSGHANISWSGNEYKPLKE